MARLVVPGGLSVEDHDSLYSFIETVRGRPYMKITTILSKLMSAEGCCLFLEKNVVD